MVKQKQSDNDTGGVGFDVPLSTKPQSDLWKGYVRPAGVEPFVIKKTETELLLIYSPKNGAAFVDDNIWKTGECRIASGVFVFCKEDVRDFGSSSIESRTFVMARIARGQHDGYYLMLGRVLGITHNVLFFKDVEISMDWFTPWDSGARLSVFQKMSRLIDEDIVIGGSVENAIPYEYWGQVVKQFPGKTEVSYYVESRIENLLMEYLPTIKRSNSLLQRYLAKRRKKAPHPKRISDWRTFDAYEIDKYYFLYNSLKEMLSQEELTELEWEQMILRFILLLYPQYVHAERQLVIHERLTNSGKKTKRRIDIALFNAEGHLDLIEIKRPSVGEIFRTTHDHDNNIPSLALSKTIMQIEKYVLYLQKGGYELECELNEAYPCLLPNKTPIRIVNPRGIIVFGRSRELSLDQVLDLEVLRRKFSHIIDILTYDDLLKRFESILLKFQMRPSCHL